MAIEIKIKAEDVEVEPSGYTYEECGICHGGGKEISSRTGTATKRTCSECRGSGKHYSHHAEKRLDETLRELEGRIASLEDKVSRLINELASSRTSPALYELYEK